MKLGKGEIDEAAYDAEITRLIHHAIRWQEEMGLDVLVHGEFERTDMVEYFAVQMDGYLTTSAGWVLVRQPMHPSADPRRTADHQ